MCQCWQCVPHMPTALSVQRTGTVNLLCLKTRSAVDSALRYGGKISLYCGVTSRSVYYRNCNFQTQTAASLFMENQFSIWTALCWWGGGRLLNTFNKLRWTVRTVLTSWTTSSFPTRILVDRFSWSFTPICWRNVVSVSTQTDLLEKYRVCVHTDAITVKESHLVLIFGGKST